MMRRQISPLSVVAPFTEAAEVLCARCGPELFIESLLCRLSELKKRLTPSGVADYGATAPSERSSSQPSGEMALYWFARRLYQRIGTVLTSLRGGTVQRKWCGRIRSIAE